MQYTGTRHKRHTAQVSHWVSSVRGPSLNMATPAMRSRPGAAVRPCEGHSSSWPGSPRITGPGTRQALAGLGPRPHSADLLTVSSSWWETTVQVFGGKGSLFFPCGHTCPNKAGGGALGASGGHPDPSTAGLQGRGGQDNSLTCATCLKLLIKAPIPSVKEGWARRGRRGKCHHVKSWEAGPGPGCQATFPLTKRQRAKSPH